MIFVFPTLIPNAAHKHKPKKHDILPIDTIPTKDRIPSLTNNDDADEEHVHIISVVSSSCKRLLQNLLASAAKNVDSYTYTYHIISLSPNLCDTFHNQNLYNHGITCEYSEQLDYGGSVQYHSEEWKQRVLQKLTNYKKAFEKYVDYGGTALFCDVDVVFVRDPIVFYHKLTDKPDLVFSPDAGDKDRAVNTGFYFVRKTHETERFLEKSLDGLKAGLTATGGDQGAIQLVLNTKEFDFAILPSNQFLHGVHAFGYRVSHPKTCTSNFTKSKKL